VGGLTSGCSNQLSDCQFANCRKIGSYGHRIADRQSTFCHIKQESKKLEKAASNGLIRGLLTDAREDGIISLQYDDDI
jgi:hypothetical protein